MTVKVIKDNGLYYLNSCSDHSFIRKAKVLFLRDDQVVQHLDIHHFAGFLQFLGDLLVSV